MIVAVTGGKGGTGKTSIALSIALQIDEPVTYVDADVEAPNAAILLGTKMKEIKNVTRKIPRINEEKCIKCGLCAQACPVNALAFVPGKTPLFFKENCIGCMLCKEVCPVGAIEEVEERIGVIRKGKKGNITIYDAIADPGIEETGPVVRELLETAMKEMDKNIIIDTAAGIHCNVIRALLPAEKVIVVTEPTPYGLHDLQKVIRLLERMGKTYEIYANKWGISKDYQQKIEEIAEGKNIPLVKIPYSREFARKYAEGVFAPLRGQE